VGRPERHIETNGPVQRFALELRQLREAGGRPSYRQMSALAHFSVTALSEAAGGKRLPSLPVALAYVHACGGDSTEWERRWHAAAAELAGNTPPVRTPPAHVPPAQDQPTQGRPAPGQAPGTRHAPTIRIRRRRPAWSLVLTAFLVCASLGAAGYATRDREAAAQLSCEPIVLAQQWVSQAAHSGPAGRSPDAADAAPAREATSHAGAPSASATPAAQPSTEPGKHPTKKPKQHPVKPKKKD
jgi:hypothetical protein